MNGKLAGARASAGAGADALGEEQAEIAAVSRKLGIVRMLESLLRANRAFNFERVRTALQRV